MSSFITIESDSSGEVTVERSKFIAVLHHVESENEAATFIAQKRAEHRDARHNVYAYALSGGLSRFSDDGEPHGTAGKPIADILRASGYLDVCMVVTRYFGGILLGTGGLVRAYSAAASAAVFAAVATHMQSCSEIEIACSYAEYDRVCALIGKYGRVSESDFGIGVTVCAYIPVEKENIFEAALKKEFNAGLKYKKKSEKILPL